VSGRDVQYDDVEVAVQLWEAHELKKSLPIKNLPEPSNRPSCSPAPQPMLQQGQFDSATSDTHLAVHAQPPSLSSSPMTVPLDSDESWETSQAWSMGSTLPILPSHYTPDMMYPMACAHIPSAEQFKMSQPAIASVSDMTGSPGDSTSLYGMSHLANLNYNAFPDVQAGIYRNVSGLSYTAGPCSNTYQSSIPHNCTTTSTDGIQAFVPPWQMTTMDESCRHNKLNSDDTYPPQTSGANLERLPITNAPSPASVQSTRRGSLASFATIPEQSLTSYDAYEYQAVMSDALSMASYTPAQSFARLALDQSPAQQITPRRRSVETPISQQQWNPNSMAQPEHAFYGHGLPYIPPTSCLPFCR
jgi:hypothetical protein